MFNKGASMDNKEIFKTKQLTVHTAKPVATFTAERLHISGARKETSQVKITWLVS